MVSHRPLIFTDIDGVLRADTRPSDYQICPVRLARLQRLMSSTGAELVISSSWRLAFSLSELSQRLGVTLRGFTGTAPAGEPENRLDEIARYIASHGLYGRAFVIFDDRRDLFPTECPNLIVCDPELGLGDAQISCAQALLAPAQGRAPIALDVLGFKTVRINAHPSRAGLGRLMAKTGKDDAAGALRHAALWALDEYHSHPSRMFDLPVPVRPRVEPCEAAGADGGAQREAAFHGISTIERQLIAVDFPVKGLDGLCRIAITDEPEAALVFAMDQYLRSA